MGVLPRRSKETHPWQRPSSCPPPGPPIGKAYRGAFNNTHGADIGGHVISHAVKRAGHRAGGGRGRHPRLRAARGRDRPEHRAAGRATRGAARDDGRHDRQPLLLVGDAGDRAGRAACDRRQGADRGGGRPRVDQPRADRAHEPAPDARRVARGAQARDLHDDDRDGRGGGQALLHHPREAGRVRADEPAALARRVRRRDGSTPRSSR